MSHSTKKSAARTPPAVAFFKNDAYLTPEIQNWLCADRLSKTDLLILLAVNNLARDNRVGCFASNKYLGDAVGVGEESVRKCLRKLKKFGLVRCEYRTLGGNSQRHVWPCWKRWDLAGKTDDTAYAPIPDDVIPPPGSGGDRLLTEEEYDALVGEGGGKPVPTPRYASSHPPVTDVPPPGTPVPTPKTLEKTASRAGKEGGVGNQFPPPGTPVPTIRRENIEEDTRQREEKTTASNQGGCGGDSPPPSGAAHLADLLWTELRKKRRVSSKPTGASWHRLWVLPFLTLLSDEGRGVEEGEVAAVISFHAEQSGKKYHPVADAASTFVEKYTQIADRLRQSVEDQDAAKGRPDASKGHSRCTVITTPALKDYVMPDIEHLQWPRDCAAQLPHLLETAYASVRPFWQFLRARTASGGSDGLTQFCEAFLERYPSPSKFLVADTIDMNQAAWENHRKWKAWKGILTPTTTDSAEFRNGLLWLGEEFFGTGGPEPARYAERMLAAYREWLAGQGGAK